MLLLPKPEERFWDELRFGLDELDGFKLLLPYPEPVVLVLDEAGDELVD